ncbi:type III toxin-antitoxin system ToxN/AbiQ family toxin [Parablautia muri]|uniref:type III toxin-antitoxin system ToxN/AbiQ family toxin n=1 Tax=Parablautia muri TaxID=2320879 RepID=UPI002ED44D90
MLSVSPQAGKDNRVFVGIVIICGTHKYCIPLSSPKEKHKKMKNYMDFSKIEINGELLGVLNFYLMIPIEENQLQLIDTTIFKRDRESIKYYKRLCVQESECKNYNSKIKRSID